MLTFKFLSSSFMASKQIVYVSNSVVTFKKYLADFDNLRIFWNFCLNLNWLSFTKRDFEEPIGWYHRNHDVKIYHERSQTLAIHLWALDWKQNCFEWNFLLMIQANYPSQRHYYSMNLKHETSLGACKCGLPKGVTPVFEACLVLCKKVILYLQTPLKIILLDAKHYPICKYFNWINGSLTQRIYNHNSIITQLIWSILSGNVSKGFTNSGELYWAVPLLKKEINILSKHVFALSDWLYIHTELFSRQK